MQEYRVQTVAELHEVLGRHRRDAGWMCRGQADAQWPLVPREGREAILFELSPYGVNAQVLFPDLVGLSRHFNWVMASFDDRAEGLAGSSRQD